METSIFSEILDKALKNSASDIHIGAGERPLMRVDGLLRAAGETPLSEEGSYHRRPFAPATAGQQRVSSWSSGGFSHDTIRATSLHKGLVSRCRS